MPVLTLYTLPAIGANSVVETTWAITETEGFRFRWSGTAPDGTPAVFVLRPASNGTYSFVSDETGEFRFGVYGAEGGTISLPNATAVLAYTWAVDYVAKRMQAYTGFFARTWIEIDFTPEVPVTCACDLPYANVSAPELADLSPAGIVDSLTLSGTWQYSRSLANFSLPTARFHHVLPAVAIPVGDAGNVTATLESWFAWGPAGDYRATIQGSGTVAATVTWYWDVRFGGLYPVVR